MDIAAYNIVASVRLMRQLVSNGLLSAGLGLLFSLSNLVLMVVYQAQLALVAGLFSLVSALAMGLLVWRNARLERPLGISNGCSRPPRPSPPVPASW